MNKIKLYFCLISSLIFVRCNPLSLNNAGTHGAIIRYTYPIPKDSLNLAIEFVINNTKEIQNANKKDEGTAYNRIIINAEVVPYVFVFRYYGDKEDWKSNQKSSEIFITAIKKDEGEYKKQGNIARREIREAINVFEKYFIIPLNRKLRITGGRN